MLKGIFIIIQIMVVIIGVEKEAIFFGKNIG
jgi:hypothetical protein